MLHWRHYWGRVEAIGRQCSSLNASPWQAGACLSDLHTIPVAEATGLCVKPPAVRSVHCTAVRGKGQNILPSHLLTTMVDRFSKRVAIIVTHLNGPLKWNSGIILHITSLKTVPSLLPTPMLTNLYKKSEI